LASQRRPYCEEPFRPLLSCTYILTSQVTNAYTYDQDGPKVLQDISFQIRSGERVGIVGRTGSGKSSLTLSLLRCIPTEGEVYYAGIRADVLNLDALRSNITVIPQVVWLIVCNYENLLMFLNLAGTHER
jgi:ABC-type multidrug transport system fused ATPase/permease subunit